MFLDACPQCGGIIFDGALSFHEIFMNNPNNEKLKEISFEKEIEIAPSEMISKHSSVF